MSATVDARLPLSLLEAVRLVDRPEALEEAEYVEELRLKRFGLSDTVYQQIRRYADAVRRGERTAREEVMALARLIGRRADAHRVFESAGSWLAADAVGTVSALRRTLIRVLPGMLARPLALGAVRRLARRYLDGDVQRVGAHVLLAVEQPVTDEGQGTAGHAFYAAAFAELLERLTTSPAVVTRVDAARGARWRADWGRR
ncbi:MAG: hypothetical protein MUF21_04420 [Gemmatimonadaceae bacterium]|jgi:hypothetical protein|nr:hypothetical protein [Gemmatimonadaceae bacterium]